MHVGQSYPTCEMRFFSASDELGGERLAGICDPSCKYGPGAFSHLFFVLHSGTRSAKPARRAFTDPVTGFIVMYRRRGEKSLPGAADPMTVHVIVIDAKHPLPACADLLAVGVHMNRAAKESRPAFADLVPFFIIMNRCAKPTGTAADLLCHVRTSSHQTLVTGQCYIIMRRIVSLRVGLQRYAGASQLSFLRCTGDIRGQ